MTAVYQDNKKWAELAFEIVLTNPHHREIKEDFERLFEEHAAEVEYRMMKAFEGHI